MSNTPSINWNRMDLVRSGRGQRKITQSLQHCS